MTATGAAGAGSAHPATVAESALDPVAEHFLVHLRVERGRAPLTIQAYRRDLLRYCGFLATRGSSPGQAVQADVDAYGAALRSQGLAPTTVTRMLATVRNLHRWMAAEQMRPDDPTRLLPAPRLPRALPKALDADVVARLLDSAEGSARQDPTPLALRDLALLEVLYGTGARVSEVCGLGFGDVDLDGELLRVMGKRSKERIVPLGGPARRALADWLDRGRPHLVPSRWRSRDDADAVFLGVRGGRLTRQGAWLVLRRHLALAGIPDRVGPHVLRHSCATHLLDNGADLRAVAEMLGHASVSTTQLYTRVATETLHREYRRAHPRSGS